MNDNQNFRPGRTLQVLHIDDNFVELRKVKSSLEEQTLEFKFHVLSIQEIPLFKLELSKKNSWDIALIDIEISEPEDGLELVKYCRKKYPNIVLIMRSNSDDAYAVRASFDAGADDFIAKKSDQAELCLRINHAYHLAQLKRGSDSSLSGLALHKGFEAVGETMARIARRVPLLIESAVSAVHISGESGTGKEVVADLFGAAIAPLPFVKVNCGAITPSLLESELFGHSKGSFTGANAERQGFIETASGGWLFLDEVSTLSTSAQIALLRVLENQEVTRLGESKPRRINVRVLSACNDSLESLVLKGTFRKDLWQRLRETEISLIPLRERATEVANLANYFCQRMRGGPYRIAQTALEILQSHDWADGNIRELRNCLRAMTELHVRKELTPQSIPDRFLKVQKKKPVSSLTDDIIPHNSDYDILEKEYFLSLVKKIHGSQGDLSMRKIALTLNMSKSAVGRKIASLISSGICSELEIQKYMSNFNVDSQE